MARVLSRLQTDRLRSVCVKGQAQKEFNQWVQSRMPDMVWSGPCNSWCKFYSLFAVSIDFLTVIIDKNDSGKVIVPWPGTVLHYYAATTNVRWEDFDFEYEDPNDKFGSFGNGVTLDGFVPDQFPWVHRPVVQNPTKEKIEPIATTSRLPSIWLRGKIKFTHILATRISS